jgi:ABC-2 type transport system permease protein
VTGFWPVAATVARTTLKTVFTNPALLVPSILFPLVFLLAFAGGLSSIGDTPGFEFRSGYTSFQFVFVFLQAAAFGGVFTGFGVAVAFESGFGRRLMLAAASRAGIIAGTSWRRSALRLHRAHAHRRRLLAGMEIDGTSPQFAALLLLGFLLNAAARCSASASRCARRPSRPPRRCRSPSS